MRQSPQEGDNRTGMMSAGERAEAMVEATAEFSPSSPGSADAIAEVRLAYAQEGETFGETPSPTRLPGRARSAVSAVTGGQPTMLMDKLGERLMFEHVGARLYEALISKHQAYGAFPGGPTEQDLLDILQQEYEHADLLERAIKNAGGDPTALTPSANLAATISAGLPQVLSDPRTNVLESLEAILVAELSDNECWTALEILAGQAGNDELVAACGEAILDEREHLVKVRAWVAAGQGREAGDGAPLPASTDDEETTFTDMSDEDDEGFVISEEEQGAGNAATDQRPRKSRKKKSGG